jgi:hypothetical protein
MRRIDDTGATINASSSFPTPIVGRYYIVTMIFSSAYVKTWVNGTLYGNASLNVGTMSAFDTCIIGRSLTLGSYFSGKLVELLIGARTAWSDTDRQNLEAYLSSKYQIPVAGGPDWVAPVANADTIDTGGAAVGFPLYVTAADVLANDTHDSRTALEIISVQSPSGGSVALLTDQTIEFVPSGTTCSFQYTVADGLNNQSSATVTLTGVVEVSDIALWENFLSGIDVGSVSVTRSGAATHIDNAGEIAIDGSNTQRFNYSPEPRAVLAMSGQPG